MSLPERTPEQRKRDLEKALWVRKDRADLKEKLKDGRLSLEQVIEQERDVVQKMYVVDLLACLPKVGKKKAVDILAELDIAQNRRVRGLGARQKRALADRFGYTTAA